MGRPRLAALAEVQELRRRIERWRKTRVHGTKMPEPLWAATVALASKHGVHRVSAALGVQYGTLRDRVAAAAAARARAPGRGRQSARSAPPPSAQTIPAAVAFVELAAVAKGDAAEPATVVLELVRPDHAKLTVRLGEKAETAVAAIVKAFVGSR